MKNLLLFLILFLSSLSTHAQIVCRSSLNLALGADGTVTLQPMDVIISPSTPRPGSRYTVSPSFFNCADHDQTFSVIVTEVRGSMFYRCVTNVYVEDKNLQPSPCIPPTVYCIANLNANIGSDGTLTLNPEDLAARPLNPAFDWSVEPSTFDCRDVGTHTVKLIATSSNGSSNYCWSQVNIVDPRPWSPTCFRIRLRDRINFFPSIAQGNPVPSGSIINFDFILERAPEIKPAFDVDFRMVLSRDKVLDDNDLSLYANSFKFKNKIESFDVQSKFAIPQNISPGYYYIIADATGAKKTRNVTFEPFVTEILVGVDGQITNTQSRTKNGENIGIQVSPNPFTDFLDIRTSTEMAKKVEVIDIFGKQIRVLNMPSHESRLSLDGLPSALYIIKVSSPEGSVIYSAKFCKI